MALFNVLNYLKNLFDISDIVSEIIKTIGGIAISSVIALIYILYNKRSRSFYKALYKSIFSNNAYNNKTEYREKYKKFHSYIPHNVTNSKDKTILSFKDFIKIIKNSNTKCIFVFGPSGIGKSTLMQQLAFRFKVNRLKNKAHGLLDYGIIYRQFNSQMLQKDIGCDAIRKIFQHLNNDLVNSNIENATILLDGFDEIADLLVEDSKKVFAELIEQIHNLINQHLQTKKINKIIISLRPEIFANGLFELNDLNFPKLIFEVNKFNKKQALTMYRNVSAQNGETRSTRKKNLSRLERIMDNSKADDSVFSYPFIMEWAPELFAEFRNDDKLTEQNLYLILNTVINKALEREERILQKVYSKKSEALSNEIYSVVKGRAFIRSVAVSKLKNTPCEYSITYDELTKDTEKANERLIKTTRRLLRVSENSSAEGQQATYTFLHNMFYWFEVADILSDTKSDITKQERADILDSLKHTLVPTLYIQALKEKYGKNIAFSSTLPNSPNALSHIDFINSEGHPSAFVDELFALLPYLQTLTLNGVSLNKNTTEDLINKAELDLSDRNAYALKCLDCFSSDYIKSLDISSCNINSSDVISRHISHFNNLQILWASGNPVSLEELCEDAEKFKSNPTLLCSLRSAQELNFLKHGYQIPFKEIQVTFSDDNPFNPLYKSIYDKRQNGFNISVWNPSAFSEQDKCSDISLLEAIYELDKLIMIRTINKRLAEFLPIAVQYISFLKKRNDDIQIKIETDFINDIINCNGLAEHSIWFDSVSISDTDEADIEKKYKNCKADMNLVLEAYIDNFIRTACIYASASEEAGDEEKIKNIFDYVADITVDKCKLNKWCIKYKSLYEDRTPNADFFKFLNISANCKNPKSGYAQFLLGNCFLNGKYIKKDHKLAFVWFQKSAENGCAMGMNDFGWCYMNGYGTDENKNMAFHWFEKSAENGCAMGMNSLGWCYMNGYGTDENKNIAFYWFEKAAKNGCAEGMNHLGLCYWDAYGTEENDELAFYWLEKAAKNGSAAGMNHLGLCYWDAYGTEENDELAFYWLEKAAKNGSAAGMYHLGVCYQTGYGTEENEKMAFYWYKKSAESGDQDAIIKLIWCYETGYGTEPDDKEAEYWRKKLKEK